MLSYISLITAYLFYTYAANAKTHLLGGKTSWIFAAEVVVYS